MEVKTLLSTLCFGCILTGFTHAALIAEVRTSAGNFSIDLDYEGAPRTVSHFYRLAAGLQPWLDEKTGVIRNGVKFYDNLKFYKKVEHGPPLHPIYQKYIQAGIRYPGDVFVFIPDAKQGAGYVLRDEIKSDGFGDLDVPHGLYTVSMANNGPNSSSSQFFINLLDDSSWNGRNSAFGVVEQVFIEYPAFGLPYVSHNGFVVVNAILTSQLPVTIFSIRFRITNNSPLIYDSTEFAGELPVMMKRDITSVTHNATDVVLGYGSLFNGHEMRQMFSLDLFTWQPAPAQTQYVPANISPTVNFAHGGTPRAFFRTIASLYPISTVPTNLNGKRIRIALNIPYATQPTTNILIPIRNVLQLYFDVNGITNTYLQYSDGSTGTFTYTFTARGPYHADLEITPDGLASKTYRLYFGGMGDDVTEDGQMHALIDPDIDPPIEARWWYN
jgi:cyclophilin family peptidyl-prolyl cis-trans isomerase